MENKSESNIRSLKVILGILALLLVATAFYTYTLYTDSEIGRASCRERV